jgi:predicted nucleic acid-binding protein
MPIRLPNPEMSLALDNDIFTAWRNQQLYVLRAINEYQSRLKVVPALTSFTVFEALHGIEKEIAKGGKDNELLIEKRATADSLIQSCIVLPFDNNAATIAAHILPRVPKKQRHDVFIAATVLAHGYALATRNRKDFEIISNHLPPQYRYLFAEFWKP